jgi:hypothetical protein
MKKLMMALAVAAFALTAQAAEEKKPTAQQEKMTACNKEAGTKKLEGDARKAFMSECLSAKPAGAASAAKPTAAATSPACEKSADEKKLAGAARSSHIKKCMADSTAAAASAAKPTAATTSAACEKSADEQKLAGAARSSHIKKCMADSPKS